MSVNFVAIDFETANYSPNSACAVGLAVVRGGKVAETFASLIRPPELDFRADFVDIHGITPEQVADAPTFADVWPGLLSLIGDGPLAAHNSPFDMRVLRACLDTNGIPRPAVACLCTLSLARQVLPKLANHRLNTLAAHFDIPLDHHNAASDAIACAHMALQLASLAGPHIIQRLMRPF